MEKGSVRFCIFCGKENDPAGSFCAACGKPLYPTEDLLADYLKKEAKEQLTQLSPISRYSLVARLTPSLT